MIPNAALSAIPRAIRRGWEACISSEVAKSRRSANLGFLRCDNEELRVAEADFLAVGRKKRATAYAITLLHLPSCAQSFDSVPSRNQMGFRSGLNKTTKARLSPGFLCVDREGIEPPTHGFSVHCSTN